MNLTGTDLTIIVVFGGSVVIMSFMFPALGFAGTEQTQSDIPEFNVTQTRFDFAGDLPEFPSAPSKGILNHTSDKFDDFRGDIQTELGDSSAGNRTFIVAINETAVHLTDVEASTIDAAHNFTSDGETATLTAYGYEIDVHAVDLTYGEFEWIAVQRPEDQTFLGSIPIIGGLFSAGNQLASIVGWVGVSFFVISQIIAEGALNTGGLIFDAVVWFIDMAHWLTTTWFDSVDNAPGYAKVILTVIAVPLFYEFVKFVVIGINLVKPFA